MKKLLLIFTTLITTGFSFAGDNEPLITGLWRFDIHRSNARVRHKMICIDHRRFWRVSQLNRVPGCRARLVRRSSREKVWSLRCNFANGNKIRGRVVYGGNYYEQRYTTTINNRSSTLLVRAHLRRRGICAPNTYYRPSLLLPFYDDNAWLFGE